MRFDYEQFIIDAAEIQQDVNFILNHVSQFREYCGLPINSAKPNTNLHMSLMKEELGELEEAESKEDFADALADIMVVAGGWWVDSMISVPFEIQHLYIELRKIARRKKINLIEAFKIVHSSNMSKLCYSEDEIRLTEKMHQDAGVSVEFKETQKGVWSCLCSKDSTRKDGKEIKKGKLLKSVGFEEPDWKNRQEWQR